MVLRAVPISLSPEDEKDQVIVSRKKLDRLVKENQEQGEEITRLREKLRKRESENADLRHQLTVHVNPNVPPSVRHHAPGYPQDRPRVPVGERKTPGAKPGHEGSTREPVHPDEKVSLTTDTCVRCHGHRLQLQGTEKKQEFEVIRRTKVTEYTQAVYTCLDCGTVVRATLPDGREPSGYGPQLQSEIVRGKVEERLPYRKIEERLEREGIPSCPATLQGVVWGASEKLGGTWVEIRERIRQASVVYADETSFRVGGKKWWLWTFTTETDTLLVMRPSRGEGVVAEVLGAGFPGKVVVCDGWKAYPHEGWVLQRCWAHLLRVAKAGAEESPKARELYEALSDLYTRLTKDLEEASPRVRAYRATLGEKALTGLEARFGKSWAGGVRKVMTYLKNGMPWWLTFLRHPGVEPTNNRGERSLREAVVIRKIVGTLRNREGAEALSRLLSVIGTWKLRGEDPAKNLYATLS